jgi:GH24 family phage-related lysozyme (muramidase)
MLKKVNAARHDQVPGQVRRWNRTGGKVLKGLECTREAEAALYAMSWYEPALGAVSISNILARPS